MDLPVIQYGPTDVCRSPFIIASLQYIVGCRYPYDRSIARRCSFPHCLSYARQYAEHLYNKDFEMLRVIITINRVEIEVCRVLFNCDLTAESEANLRVMSRDESNLSTLLL